MEEMDLRWKIAMLTIGARKVLKKTRRNLTFNGNETIGFDKSNVECYNYHKRGHFAREYRALKNQDNNHKESSRRSVPVKTTNSTVLISCDGLEAVNTACYVRNKVLVVKPHNKTAYELSHGKTPTLSFLRPFGCPVTILNTLDHIGKFDGKADEGFFVRYSLNSKAFIVFNSRTTIVKENLHIRFNESTPNVIGSRPDWLYNIDALTRTMNCEPIVADPKSSHDDGFKPSSDDGKKVDEDPSKKCKCIDQEKEDNVYSTKNVNTVSSTVNAAGTNEDN
nr:ribonuclease H-like domain-containing protein [Tanacetum cinerariifolium]